jgi:hypothetical protein
MEIFRFHWLSLQLKFSCHYLLDSGEDFVSNCKRSSFFFNSSFPTSLMSRLYQAFRCLQAPAEKFFYAYFPRKTYFIFFLNLLLLSFYTKNTPFRTRPLLFRTFYKKYKEPFFLLFYLFFFLFCSKRVFSNFLSKNFGNS